MDLDDFLDGNVVCEGYAKAFKYLFVSINTVDRIEISYNGNAFITGDEFFWETKGFIDLSQLEENE